MGMLEPNKGEGECNKTADRNFCSTEPTDQSITGQSAIELDSATQGRLLSYKRDLTKAIQNTDDAHLRSLINEVIPFSKSLREELLKAPGISKDADTRQVKALRILEHMNGEISLERWLSRQLLACLKTNNISSARVLIEGGFVCAEDLRETVKLLGASGKDFDALELYFEKYGQKLQRVWQDHTSGLLNLWRSGSHTLAAFKLMQGFLNREEYYYEGARVSDLRLQIVQLEKVQKLNNSELYKWASQILEGQYESEVKMYSKPLLWIVQLEECIRDIAESGNTEAFRIAVEKSGLSIFGGFGIEGISGLSPEYLEESAFSGASRKGRVDFIEHYAKRFPAPFPYSFSVISSALRSDQPTTAKRLLTLLPADAYCIDGRDINAPIMPLSVESLASDAWQVGNNDFFEELVKKLPRIDSQLPRFVGVALTEGQLEVAKNLITRLPFNGPGPVLNFNERIDNPAGNRFASTVRYLYEQGSPGSIFELFPQVPRDQYSGLTKSGLASSFEEILLETAALASTIEPDSKEVPHLLFVELMQENLRHWSGARISMKQARNSLIGLSSGFESVRDMLREFSDLVLLPNLLRAFAEEFGTNSIKNLNSFILNTIREHLIGQAGRILFNSRRSSDVYRFNALWHRPDKAMPIECTPLRACGEWTRCIGDLELSNGWSIHALGTQAELIEEGNLLKHCLGRGGYGPNCLKGELQVLSLRYLGRPNSTILLEKDSTKQRRYSMTIKMNPDFKLGVPQFVSVGNSRPDAEAQAAFDEFIEMIKSREAVLELDKWGETQLSRDRRRKLAISESELITGCSIEDGGKKAEDYYRTQLRLYDKRLPKALQEGEPLLRSEIDADTLKDMFPNFMKFYLHFSGQA